MSLFGEYLKETNLEAIEEGVQESVTDALTNEMAHIQKFIYIPNPNSSWANSVFKGIYDAKKEYTTRANTQKKAEIYTDTTLNTAYADALKIIIDDNPQDINIIPNIRPDFFTFEFLWDFEGIRNYLINNAKNKSFERSINEKCDLYKNKRIR